MSQVPVAEGTSETRTQRVTRKRPRSFSAATFSASLSTRLREASDSLLRCLDTSGLSESSLEVPFLSVSAGRVPGPNVGVVVARNRGCAFRARGLASPGPFTEELLQPLAVKRRVGDKEPSFASNCHWPSEELKGCLRPASSARKPLGYAQYLAWIRMILPEQMDPYRPEHGEDFDGSAIMEDLRKRLEAQSLGPPPLTEEEQELAAKSLEEGDPNEVLVSKFSVDVTRQQLACLLPCTWLNDEVVNFYCKLLQERRDQDPKGPSCWFTNTFFWPKLAGQDGKTYSYKDVKRWTIRAKVDIFEKDYVIFPMNMGGNHWATGAINLRDKCFHYLDSLSLLPPKNFVTFLQKYLNDEHQAKRGGVPLEGVDAWQHAQLEVPQQANGYDCGVFTCCIVESLSAGKEFSFCQDDMEMMRQRLAARIVRGESQWTN
mmetsp:Transcript_51803/g.123273  ORF Transcript_51803/g.123273 Transcript_51803/m.123273 type:complete len:431 (-) Transcript_51803:14-1306(-)